MLGSYSGKSVPDELGYGMLEQGFSGFEEGWTWAVADPVEVRVNGHAEGAVRIFGFVAGVRGV